MSGSYRKPYAALCGGDVSAKEDKRRAARGVRHKQNQWLRTLGDFDGALVPHRYECRWNDVWTWKRDGGKRLVGRKSDRDWSEYCRVEQGLWHYPGEKWYHDTGQFTNEWPPKWYIESTRK